MSAAVLRRDALLACAGLALLVTGAAILADAAPWTLVQGIAQRALFTRAGLMEALLRAIPLTVMGLGIALAFRARIFNIGMDGQLIAGSVLAVAVAPLLPANMTGMMLFLIAGFAGGAFWGGIAGVIRGRFGGNEIIATIMLNYVAIQILSWLVRGPLQEKMKIIPRSDAIEGALRLPLLLEGTRIHFGLIVALLVTIVVAVVLTRSRFGFRVDVVGANGFAARYAGIDTRLVAGLLLALSGALAGLAGAIEVAGVYGRLQEGFAPGFGIAAIAVALVARLNPVWVPLSSFLFSLLYVGLGALARNGVVPAPFINIIEGVIILGFLAGSVALAARKPAAKDGSDG
jgi:ABC-type uncharacterized transport system permease subunit